MFVSYRFSFNFKQFEREQYAFIDQLNAMVNVQVCEKTILKGFVCSVCKLQRHLEAVHKVCVMRVYESCT